MKDATIVDISDTLGLSDDEYNYIHGRSVADPGVQDVIVRSDRWSGLIEALISESSGLAMGGCRVTLRTDRHGGVLSDSACEKEVALFNCLSVHIGSRTMPIFQAKQFRLTNIDGTHIGRVIDRAIAWANEPVTPDHDIHFAMVTPGTCDGDPTDNTECRRSMESVLQYTYESTFPFYNRQSPPYRTGIVVRLQPRTEPIVEIKEHLVATFVPDVPQPPPIVVDTPTVRRWSSAKRSKSPAVKWLGDDPSHDGDHGGGSTGTQPPPSDDRIVWADGRGPFSQDIESADGGGGQVPSQVVVAPGSLGSIVSDVGLPLPADRPVWARNYLGESSTIAEAWYDELVGHGCGEPSIMGFMALAQYSNGGWCEAKAIIDRLHDTRRTSPTGEGQVISRPSAFVWDLVDKAFRLHRPSGARFTGKGGKR